MTNIYRIFEAHAPAVTLRLIEHSWSPAGTFAIEALSDYAEQEGFARYDQMDLCDRTEFVWADTDRFAGAIYTNTEICAALIGHKVRKEACL